MSDEQNAWQTSWTDDDFREWDAAFRARVEGLMAVRGITVHDLCRKAGLGRGFLESPPMEGYKGVGIGGVVRLSKVLDCHPAYLMFGLTPVTDAQTPWPAGDA